MMKSDQTRVIPSAKSPTGFMAHFVLEYEGSGTPMVTGDWMFSDEFHSGRLKSARIWPHQWRPGCFAHKLMGLKQTPKALTDGTHGTKIDPSTFEFDWDVLKLGMYPMTKNPGTGLWEADVPLPCGAFIYRFVTDMPEGNPLRMVTQTDPAHPSASYKDEICDESTIFIPYNPEGPCPDRSFELPYEGSDRGEIRWIDYTDTLGLSGKELQQAAVYLPFGYDPDREEPYKVLYLSHGGSENASSWIGKGCLCNILDRRIHEGLCEPLVVVMMNNEVFKWDNEARCIPNLLQQLIPFTQAHFHVRTDPAGMAFAGFSAGGFLAADLLADHPEAFGAIGVWSGGLRRSQKVWEPQQYKDLKIHIGAGRYDDAFYTFANPLEEALSFADIDFTSYYPFGGHQWTVWRSLLDDFVTRVFGTPEK